MLAVVINMDRDKKRMEDMREKMEDLGIEWERLPAVDGKADPDSSYIHENANVTPSERGVIKSHLKAWDKMKEYNLDRILVLEDDITTQLSGLEIRNKIDETSSLPYDLLFLGKCLDDCLSYQPTDIKGVFRSRSPLCTHAYIITRSGVEKIMREMPFKEPVDIKIQALVRSGVLTAYVFHPSIIVQDVINYGSGLRSKLLAMNNICECLREHDQRETFVLPQQEGNSTFGENNGISILVIAVLALLGVVCIYHR